MGIGSALGSIVNAVVGGRASETAGRQLERALGRGRQTVEGYGGQALDTVDQYGNQAMSYQQPFADMGRGQAVTLGNLMNQGAFNAPADNFQFSGEDVYNDPSYQFRLKEGQGALENSAAARGGLLSGATMKALQKYGQNFASQEYGNAYNRARSAHESDRNYGMTNRQNQFQNRYSLANLGVNASNNMSDIARGMGSSRANIYSGMGSTLGDLDLQKGNAQAAATMGKAQAWGNAARDLGQAGDDLFNSAMLGGM